MPPQGSAGLPVKLRIPMPQLPWLLVIGLTTFARPASIAMRNNTMSIHSLITGLAVLIHWYSWTGTSLA
jgi:hypothetical protein